MEKCPFITRLEFVSTPTDDNHNMILMCSKDPNKGCLKAEMKDSNAREGYIAGSKTVLATLTNSNPEDLVFLGYKSEGICIKKNSSHIY